MTGDARSSAASAARLTAWLLAAAGLVFVALAWPMLQGKVYVADDLGEYHLPLRQFYSQQLASGEAFDWLPSLFSGYYLTGEGQAGTYHPLHWALYRLLPLGEAFDLELLASYPLLLWGGYLLLRRWRLRRDAALFGAAAFTFSGFNLLHFVHPNAVAVIAHWPWLLWALDCALVDRRPVAAAGPPARPPAWAWALVSLNLGSQLLIGYPQYVWLGLVVAVPYALVCLARGPRPLAGRLIGLGLAVSIGVLLGSVQLVPTLDALADSNRQEVDAAFAASGSLHPLNLIQVVAPFLLATRVVGQNTHELGLYFGAVPLVLAIWLVLHREQWNGARPLLVAALWCAAVGLLMAVGQYGPLGPVLHWLPLVGKFRFPCRAIVLIYGAVAVLAAIAWQRLFAEPRREPRETVPILQSPRSKMGLSPAPVRSDIKRLARSICLVSVGTALVGSWLWHDFAGGWLTASIGPVCFAVVALILTGHERGWRAAPAALAVFTLFELGMYGLGYDAARLDVFTAHQDMPPAADRPVVAQPVDPPGTTSTSGPRTGDRILLAGFRRADGYAGLVPRRQLDFADPLALRVAGVGYRAVDDPEGYNPGVRWSEVADPLEPVRLVVRAIVDRGGEFPAEAVADDVALTAEPLDLPGGPPGQISQLEQSPGHVALVAQSDGRQLLVLNQSFHAGWQATSDGRAVPVLRVNRDFLGVVVEPGRQALTLDFRPFSLILGRAGSTLGLGLLCAQWIVAAWWARRSVAETGRANSRLSAAAESSLA